MGVADALDAAPWERLLGETNAYELFRAYRDRGPERRVVSVDGVPAPAYWRKLSKRWRWAEHAAAWDDIVWRTVDDARPGRPHSGSGANEDQRARFRHGA
jgi:hypothetical protein